MIKPEEVSLIFSKWKQESTVLHFVAFLPCGYFEFDRCRVDDFSAERIRLELSRKNGACEFDLARFVFEYGTPRLSKEEDGVVSAILAFRDRDSRLIFMETLETWDRE